MQIGAKYSHMNGVEFPRVHREALWQEIVDAIHRVDAETCRSKESREKRMQEQMLYSPVAMNRAFKQVFSQTGWSEVRSTFYVTSDEKVLRGVHEQPPEVQKAAIEAAGYTPIMSYNQTDFVKERVAVEVQFGKYAFVAHDLFVKHLSLFKSDVIDVGVEILPMKELEQRMSSGVPYYERDLLNLVRQGKGTPAVPLVLIGVLP